MRGVTMSENDLKIRDVGNNGKNQRAEGKNQGQRSESGQQP
jgi:hypothetical protein